MDTDFTDMDDIKRILIITNYRCGSTVFLQQMCEKYDLPSIGEILRNRKNANFKFTCPGIMKLMPDQLRNRDISEFTENSDKIIYLYRRNFRDQALSWIGIQKKNDHGNNGMIGNIWQGEYGETVQHTIDVNQKFADRQINQLISNWNKIKDYYPKWKGEVVCYEDYYVGDKYHPYNRKYNWKYMPKIPDYDIENIFKG